MSAGMFDLLLRSLGETVTMVLVSGVIAYVLGLPLGVLLFLTSPGQVLESKAVQRVLGTFINAGRSVPFIILLVAILPLTRWLVGTSIGTAAAIIPLAVGATPFVARIVEASLREVPAGLIQAAMSMGATPLQLAIKILLPEALPGLIGGGTITLVMLVGYSAMAGVVGGGGLGDVGIRYGYQRFDPVAMFTVVVILIALVQLIQMVGERLQRAVNHRP